MFSLLRMPSSSSPSPPPLQGAAGNVTWAKEFSLADYSDVLSATAAASQGQASSEPARPQSQKKPGLLQRCDLEQSGSSSTEKAPKGKDDEAKPKPRKKSKKFDDAEIEPLGKKRNDEDDEGDDNAPNDDGSKKKDKSRKGKKAEKKNKKKSANKKSKGKSKKATSFEEALLEAEQAEWDARKRQQVDSSSDSSSSTDEAKLSLRFPQRRLLERHIVFPFHRSELQTRARFSPQTRARGFL